MTFAAITGVIILKPTQSTSAQVDVAPPVPDRISFGTVGITSGQTLRMSVSNTIMPNDVNLPPGPSRVTLFFRLPNGSLARDGRTGEPIRRVVDLERGNTTFIDLDYDRLPPGPSRAQIRAVAIVQPPPVNDTNAIPKDSIVSTVEVINNANARTQFAVFTHPAVARGFNPQPDPPAEP